MKNIPILNIITALHCEAKPLIKHFNLKKITHLNLPFQIFINHEKTIHLIISGVGKIKMAAATTYIFNWTGSHTHSTFLNVGIAGSTQFKLGEGILVHKITEQSTQRCFYPFVSLLKNKLLGQLITVDTAQIHYPADALVDMEGSAFFQTANLFVTKEQIQLFKIISDNDKESQKNINEPLVVKLITDQINFVSEIVDYLLTLSGEEAYIAEKSDYLEKFSSSWHFTHSEKIQLQEILRRWEIANKTIDPYLYCSDEKNAKAILKKLDIHATCLY